MIFSVYRFNELDSETLYKLLQLRSEIFVVEQNCAYQDMDDKDLNALHVLGFLNNKLIAYARILAPGLSYPEAAIGRVVVSKSVRGKNFGKLLMQKSMDTTLQKFKVNEIVISAQKYLERFYSDLQFKPEGIEYLEDNIPHIQMRYKKIS
ncbi:MAG: GNAT family N-acetyltransferase [Sphingobacteriaceae bacterium]|nr:GNAT family N-acetyltransferase [Sphingobacteriaceae bacterium]